MTDKLRNVTGKQYCGACGDDGWVELAGTTTVGSVEYSRGMVPCKWCEQGSRRFQHHSAPNPSHGRYEPETNFTGSDIVPIDPPGRHFTPDAAFLRERAAAGCKVEALQAMFPRRLWPAEWAEPEPGGDRLGALLAIDDADAKRRAAAREAFHPITVDQAEVREKQLQARMALNEQFSAETPPPEPASAPGGDDQIPQHVPPDADELY